MLSWSLAVVLIFLGFRTSEGQQTQNKDICNFDPDVIFFDDEELEKLRKSYTFDGDCSPVVLKSDIDDLVETNNRFGGDIGELSVRDQQRLNVFKSEQKPSVSQKDSHFYEMKPFRRIVKPGYKTNGQDIFNHGQRKPLEILPHVYHRPFGNPLLTEDFFGRHHKQDGFLSTDERKRRQGQDRNRPLFVPERETMLPPGEDNFGNGVRPSRPGSSRRRTTSRPASFGRPNDFRPSVRPPMFGLSADQLSTPPTEFGMNGFLGPNSQRRPSTPETQETSSPRPTDEATTMPGPPSWATPPSACVQRCPNTPEYNPVCGSDRITYNNPGRLRCEQQCGKANVELRFFGVCRESVVDTGLLNRS